VTLKDFRVLKGRKSPLIVIKDRCWLSQWKVMKIVSMSGLKKKDWIFLCFVKESKREMCHDLSF